MIKHHLRDASAKDVAKSFKYECKTPPKKLKRRKLKRIIAELMATRHQYLEKYSNDSVRE